MHKIYPEEAGASRTLIELMKYMQTWVGSVNTTDTTGQGTRHVHRCEIDYLNSIKKNVLQNF